MPIICHIPRPRKIRVPAQDLQNGLAESRDIGSIPRRPDCFSAYMFSFAHLRLHQDLVTAQRKNEAFLILGAVKPCRPFSIHCLRVSGILGAKSAGVDQICAITKALWADVSYSSILLDDTAQ